jgi:hypothetical protein
MLWNVEKEQVFYRLESNKLFVATADELQPRKEETIENKLDLLQQLKDYFDNTPREVVEKEWHEYDKYNEIGPTVDEYLEYVNKIRQPQYPKTYEECCKVLNLTKYPPALVPNKSMFISQYEDFPHYYEIQKFAQLLICRDAYWKIAGEQMGLGKSWNQDYDNRCFIITNTKGNINTYEYHGNDNVILAFPTAETRDAFYENFKDIIEGCKELL